MGAGALCPRRRLISRLLVACIALDVVLVPIGVFLGAFASDPGTREAIDIATAIMVTPPALLVLLVGALILARGGGWLRAAFAALVTCGAIAAVATMLFG